MADNEIKKVIKVEEGDSTVTIKSLRKEMSELRDTILNCEKGSKQYTDAVNKLQDNQSRLNEVMKLSKKSANDEENALKKLQKEIKQYRADVLNAEEGTEEWKNAMQNLANAQFQLRDMNETARYSVNDLGEQLANCGKIVQGTMAGFSAAQGVMALFGAESENLEKVMVKLQAGIAIVQGLEGLEGLSKHVNGLVTALNSSLIPSITNAAKSMGKIGWIAVIGAVAGALLALVSHLKKTKDGIDDVRDAYDKIASRVKSTSASVDMIKGEEERAIKLMKANGATEKEIVDERIKYAEQYRDIWVKTKHEIQRQLQVEQDETKRGELQSMLDEANREYRSYVNDIANLQTDLQVLAIEATKTKDKLIEVKEETIPEPTLTGDEVVIDDSIEKIPDTKFDTSSSNGATAKYDAALYAKELTFRREWNQTLLLEDEEQYKAQLELTQQFQQDRMNLLNEAIANEDNLQLLGSLLMERSELEIEIEEQTTERTKEELKRREEARKAGLQMAVQSTSSLLGSLADIYESGDKNNEKNAKKAKQLRIAQATIDTLYGTVTAYMGTMKAFSGMPWAIPIAVLNAATVMASGIATIAKLKASDPIKGNGSGASVEPAQTYSTAMPMTAENQATNLSNIENINTNQKVYILESDIQKSNKRVEVRESESTF